MEWKSMANQWLGAWISITGPRETNAGQDINGGKQLQGWFPRNQRLGLAGTQEIMAALRKSGTQCLGPRKTGNPAINGWAQMAQIKSMASKRS